MKNILIVLFTLAPFFGAAQLPLISGDTKLKFQKGDLTWLATIDTLAAYLPGGGTVTNFSSGSLSPLFTTSVANASTTPALSFNLSNAGANTYFGNATGSSAAPAFTAAGALTKNDDTNVTLSLGGNPATALLRDASLTLGWTGTLSVARGGTGAGTLTGLLQGNGTAAVSAISNSSTVGEILRVTGAGTYGWGPLNLSDADAITGNLPVANLNFGTGASSSTFWRGDGTWAAEGDGSATNEGALTVSGTDPSLTITSNTSGSTPIQLIANAGLAFDRTGNLIDLYNTGDIDGTDDITGTGAANQIPVFTGTQAVSGSNALVYETNTLSLNPSARDTHLVINETAGRKFGVMAIQDTFNSGVNAWKVGALNRAGRLYLTSEETYVEGPLRQVTGGGIHFKGTTGDMFTHMNGDFYTATVTGANATQTRNMHWYFKSGGINGELGNPMVFQHTYDGNDTTGNCFEFLARNLAGGGITHPDSTLFRVGNWDRGTALEVKHRGRIGVGTRSPAVTLDVAGTDAIRVPVGTTAQRPTGAAGMLRFNTDSTALEWHSGSAWAKVGSGGGGGGGEANTASNVGSGSGWYKQKTGVDLEFKTLVAGGGITVASNTNDLTVSTTAPQPASSETIETTNFTATMRRINLVDCSAGTISVTPPSSPAIGDRFAVVDAEATAATNNITINFSGSSQKLYATVQNYIINVNGGYVEFIYMGTTTGWVATKG